MIKRLVSIALSLCMILSLFLTSVPAMPAHAQGQEGQLLQNTGFETGDITGWGPVTSLYEKNVFTYSGDTYNEKSNYALKLTTNIASSAERKIKFPSTAVTAGANYRFTAWFKTEGDINALVSVNNGSPSGEWFRKTSSENVDEWSKLTFDFTVNSSKTVIGIELRSTAGTGSVYWDEISIVQIDSIGGNVSEGATETVIADFEDQQLPSGTTLYYNGGNVVYNASNYAFEVVNIGTKGKYSLRLANKTVPLVQEVAVVGGTEYKFGAALNRFKGSATIKAEFYDANGSLVESKTILQDTADTTIYWQKVEQTLTAPETAEKLKLSIQRNSGTVYIDDITLKGQGSDQGYENGDSVYDTWLANQDVPVHPCELLSGGDFDSAELNGWTTSDGTIGNEYQAVTDEDRRSVVKFDATAKNLSLNQTVTGLLGGSEYTVSGMFKVTTASTNRNPAVTLTFKPKTSYFANSMGETTWFLPNYEVGKWQSFELKVYAPALTEEVKFQLRTFDGAVVLFDDVSISGYHITKSTAPIMEQGQLLQNTGFETGDVSGWLTVGSPVESDVFTYSEDTYGSQSTYSLKVSTNNADADPYLEIQMGASGGKSYRFSAWLKAENGAQAYSFVENAGTNEQKLYSTKSGWQQVTYDFTVDPAKANPTVKIFARLLNTGTILWDDISVTEIESIANPTPVGNAIISANFEDQTLPKGFEKYYARERYTGNTEFEVLNAGYHGNHSLKLSRMANSTSDVYLSTGKMAIAGNSQYEFAAMLKRVSGSAEIKVEFYQSDAHMADNDLVILADDTAISTEWQKIYKQFMTPAEATHMNLFIRWKAGKLILDDITLTGLGTDVYSVADGSSYYEALVSGGKFTDATYELLKQGDFKSADNWKFSNGVLGTDFVQDYDVTNSGTKAPVIRFKDQGKNLLIEQVVPGIVGGSTYKVSGWYKVVSAPNTGDKRPPAVKLEFLNKDGRIDETLSVTHYFSGYSVDQWTKVEFEFYAPAWATRANFMLRTFDGAEVLFDDISLEGYTSKYKVDPAAQTSILTNGVFKDENADNYPDNWEKTKKDYISLVDDRSGSADSRAVKIATVTTGVHPFVEQYVYNPKDGADYQIDGWFKTTGLGEDSYALIKVEYYTERMAAGAFANGSQNITLGASEAGEWTQFSEVFAVPEGTVMMVFYMRLIGTGEVCFDDVACRMCADINIFTAVTDGTSAPVASDFSNLLVNGYFETTDTETNGCLGWQTEIQATANNWNSSVAGKGKYVATVTGKGETGNAIKLYAGGENDYANPLIMQFVPGMEEGVTYQLSADIQSSSRMDNTGNTAMEVYYFSTETFDHYAVISKEVFYLPNTNGWTAKAIQFTAPKHTKSIAVVYRVYGQGELQVDNASLQIVERAPRFNKIETDNFFYYLEWETGTVTTTLNQLGYNEPSADDTITVTITKKGDTEAKYLETKHADAEVTFTFSIDALDGAYGDEYEVKAVYNDADNDDGDKLIATETIRTYNRPTHLDENSIYYKDGADHNEPFFPVLGYHVAIEEYAKCAANGINVMQSHLGGGTVADYPNTVKTMLDEAWKNGQMVLVTLYVSGYNAGHPVNEDLVKNVIAVAKNHPATFAYGVQDEPFAKAEDKDQLRKDLRNAYSLIRDLDPDHPVYICESANRLTQDEYAYVAKCVDAYCVDPYPGDLGPAGDAYVVWETIANIVDIVDGKKPVYSLLQAWSYRSYTPTSNDITHMIYQSIGAGAKGIGYYSIWPEYGDVGLWDRACYHGVADFANNDQEDIRKILAGQKDIFIVDTNEDDTIWYMSWMEDNDLFVVAMNMAADAHTETVTAAIPLVGSNGSAFTASGAELVYNEASVSQPELAANTVSVELAGGQIVKVKLTGETVAAEAEIVMHSIILEGNIGVNYWTKLSDAVLADETARMEFTMPNGTIESIPVSQAKLQTYGGETYHTFRCEVAAKEMADDIKAQIVYNGGWSAEDTYCVRDYALGVLENENAGEELKSLVSAMLHYGAYAQEQFGYNVTNLANSGIDSCKLDVVTKADLEKYKIETNNTELANIKATTLILNSDTKLQFFFSTNATEFTVTDSQDLPLTVYDNETYGKYVDVANVAAQDLDEAYSVTVTSGAQSSTLSACALSYCYNVLATEGVDSKLQNVVKALYLYNQAANTYFGKS